QAVSKSMVGVIVGIEHKADGFIGGFPDIRQNRLCAPWVIRVNYQHIVAKQDPAGVGDYLSIRISQAHEDAGGDFLYEVMLAGGLAEESRQKGDRKHGNG